MDESLQQMTADIVCAFVRSHRLNTNELPELIEGVGKALWEAANPTPTAEPEVQKARRKITRRRNGAVVGEASQSEGDASDDIIAEDGDDQSISDEENIVGQVEGWQTDEETGSKKAPEPMFAD